MSVEEYLNLTKDTRTYLQMEQMTNEELSNMEKIVTYNKELVEKYPFLLPRNVFDDELGDDYNYEFTWLDDMEDGWRIRFGEELCDVLKSDLEKANLLETYRIMQIKEKFGGLRWYDNGATEEWFHHLSQFEELSYHTCGKCGKEAKYMSRGWIYPFCEECAERVIKNNEYYSDEAKENWEKCYDPITD